MKDRVFVMDLPDGLDPGGFDQNWINHIWTAVNNISNGMLDKYREEQQNILGSTSLLRI